ncbi:MAG: molybdenum cofactor cytidylyltransferase [Dehalococcoidia bacterium]|nr:molybdenum cofactor cytidylyltransferase [Dehalococcoidia bacterium]MDZ4246400.1 molybdenum cofactor cytidylyltransferase [Dehalococcoidia bacterium]
MISVIILAAGESKRMGKTKQLMVYNGRTLIERAVDVASESVAEETIVVTGHDARLVEKAIKNKAVKIVKNRRYREGMGSSIRTGISSVASDADGVIIMLSDQPGLTPDVINTLVNTFKTKNGGIVVPVYLGTKGNPVLFDIKYREELLNLAGDTGARGVLQGHPADVTEVEISSHGILLDIDTEEDFRRYTGLQ